MPHSLRAKLSGLRYKGILEDKDYKRLCHALDLEKAEQEPCERFEWGIDGNVYKIIKAKDGKEICQQVCDDAISRQAAIDTIESWLSCDDYNEAERHIMRAMQSVLYDLPPVRPQEPKIVKCGWTIIPKCTTCKYLYSPIVPCSRCKDNSEFEPQESEE